eukprot:gnl/TRDRNA2_/TRDRNA2_180287_c0_seq1.p1 gnl/TRDRNA2_/TRDRNA2_180287_c0~~gnl/TRDRNA2_/TRDRNA2_180287_c0_seq1.p1  ORF type:complete len:301 (-),score=74.64 gnl/TRDRNA2_/TRDRNA2_180287_c0_seq1:44-946(-)
MPCRAGVVLLAASTFAAVGVAQVGLDSLIWDDLTQEDDYALSLLQVSRELSARAKDQDPDREAPPAEKREATPAEKKPPGPPCKCAASPYMQMASQSLARTTPKCIFIDLGASDGNSFQSFLDGKFGPLEKCADGKWEAYLVEANPQFTPDLEKVKLQHPGQVITFPATAAYSCEGTTSFSIDPRKAHNHWGSSMKTQYENGTLVKVPTMNIIDFIASKVIKADKLIVKMDIEGAEFDIIPCLAQADAAVDLVDVLYVEEHRWWGLQNNSVYTQEQYEDAKQALIKKGVEIPNDYFSSTL